MRLTTTTQVYRGLLNVFVLAVLSQIYGPHTDLTLCISKNLVITRRPEAIWAKPDLPGVY